MSFLIGLIAGILGGLVGGGGGIIMIPLMVGILKMGQHKAHGTSLVALVFTGISGAVTYAMNGAVYVTASMLIAITAILTAPAGARYAHVLAEIKLKRSFGIFVIVVSFFLLMKPLLPHVGQTGLDWSKTAVLLLTGVVSGFFTGMMGVGGGTIMVPAMVLLAGFTQHTAQGSSLLAMVFASSVGGFTHWKLGNVSLKHLPGLIPGLFAGAFLGGSLANMLVEDILRLVYAAMMVWIGVKYIRGQFVQQASF